MSLYKAGSIRAAVKELGRYKLDLVVVQDDRCDKRASKSRAL